MVRAPAEGLLEGVHAMCNRKGFASNELTPIISLGSSSISVLFGCKASKFEDFICLGILDSKLLVEVPLHQPACVRQFIVSFVWCLCDLAPSVAGAVVYFFLNPTIPPLWGMEFVAILGI